MKPKKSSSYRFSPTSLNEPPPEDVRGCIMKTLRRALLGALCAGAVSSCYYPGYDDGYSSGMGYTGGGASFAYTSSDRWFYDTSVNCYYDRTRHAYYDPWLNGYYPSGYCPQPVTYVPHPYGWNGHGTCPPPRGVNYRTIDRYNDRVALLKAQKHAWAVNVKAQHHENSQRWREQQTRYAEQFAKKTGRGGGANQPTQPATPIFGQNPRGGYAQPVGRTPSVNNNPFAPRGNSTPRANRQTPPPTPQPSYQRRGSQPAQPSQPTRQNPSSVERPGYRQPVAAPTTTWRNPRVTTPPPRQPQSSGGGQKNQRDQSSDQGQGRRNLR
jgi:hypothetical protein